MMIRRGPVAQLGARVNGIHEVTGSTPVWSTIMQSKWLERKHLREACRAKRALIEHPSRPTLACVQCRWGSLDVLRGALMF